MTDAIEPIDRAHMESMRIWTRSVKDFCANNRCNPISYKKYKVLQSIDNGNKTSYDITEDVGGVVQTTSFMLNTMFMEDLVTRQPINARKFEWSLTLKGHFILTGLEKIAMQIRGDVLACIAKNLKDFTFDAE